VNMACSWGRVRGQHGRRSTNSRRSGNGANVVTILCDEGEKYLTEYFIPASM